MEIQRFDCKNIGSSCNKGQESILFLTLFVISIQSRRSKLIEKNHFLLTSKLAAKNNSIYYMYYLLYNTYYGNNND